MKWQTWDDEWFHGLQCPVCGYRVAPGVVQDRCPECGKESEESK